VHFQPHDALWAEARQLALEMHDVSAAVLSSDPPVTVRVVEPATETILAAAYHEAVRQPTHSVAAV